MLFHFYILDALCKRSYQLYNDAIFNGKNAKENCIRQSTGNC